MFDIAIVGCGLNGLLCYRAASSLGLKVCIIDTRGKDKIVNTADNRTIAISRSSQKFLSELGIWQNLNENYGFVDYIYTFEKTTKPVLEFAKDEFFEGELGYIVRSCHLLQAMASFVDMQNFYENFEVASVEQNNDFATIKSIYGNVIEAKIVLACDGKNAHLANLLEVKRLGASYSQKAITFIAKHTMPHKNIACEQFTTNGPFASLPLKNPHESGFVWSLKNDIANYLLHLWQTEPEMFLKNLNNELSRLQNIGQIESLSDISSPPSCYPLEISFLTKRSIGKILFVGDGLNAIHPVAGQAFNMSLGDIKNLYNNIKNCTKLGLNFSLPQYLSAGRISGFAAHLKLNLSTHFLVRLYSNSCQPLKLARTLGLEIFASNKSLRKNAATAASWVG